MFDVNKYAKKAQKQDNVKSMTFRELLTAMIEGGKSFTGKKFVHSTRLQRDYLLLGTFDAEGNSIVGTDIVSLHISDKLKLKSITADAKFLELFENYPVFYGENIVVEGGIPTGEVRSWLTIAPAGALEATPASALDIAALLTGGKITTAVAGVTA